MIDEFKDNIISVYIPSKSDICLNKFDLDSKKTRKTINDSNGSYINGFEKCFLLKKDFCKYDGHSNKNVYRKISSCLNSILNQDLH